LALSSVQTTNKSRLVSANAWFYPENCIACVIIPELTAKSIASYFSSHIAVKSTIPALAIAMLLEIYSPTIPVVDV
jgi:hypothetical protein